MAYSYYVGYEFPIRFPNIPVIPLKFFTRIAKIKSKDIRISSSLISTFHFRKHVTMPDFLHIDLPQFLYLHSRSFLASRLYPHWLPRVRWWKTSRPSKIFSATISNTILAMANNTSPECWQSCVGDVTDWTRFGTLLRAFQKALEIQVRKEVHLGRDADNHFPCQS